MSVIQVQNGGSGILGTLGTLASLGGAMFGVPLLTTLGTGMSGIDAMMNGGGNAGTITQTGGALSDLLKTMSGWSKPTDGNVASGKPGDDTRVLQKARELLKQETDEDLARKWGYMGYNYGGGYNGWQL